MRLSGNCQIIAFLNTSVLCANGTCLAPTGSQCPVDIGFEPTVVERRVKRRCESTKYGTIHKAAFYSHAKRLCTRTAFSGKRKIIF